MGIIHQLVLRRTVALGNARLGCTGAGHVYVDHEFNWDDSEYSPLATWNDGECAHECQRLLNFPSPNGYKSDLRNHQALAIVQLDNRGCRIA